MNTTILDVITGNTLLILVILVGKENKLLYYGLLTATLVCYGAAILRTFIQ